MSPKQSIAFPRRHSLEYSPSLTPYQSNVLSVYLPLVHSPCCHLSEPDRQRTLRSKETKNNTPKITTSTTHNNKAKNWALQGKVVEHERGSNKLVHKVVVTTDTEKIRKLPNAPMSSSSGSLENHLLGSQDFFFVSGSESLTRMCLSGVKWNFCAVFLSAGTTSLLGNDQASEAGAFKASMLAWRSGSLRSRHARSCQSSAKEQTPKLLWEGMDTTMGTTMDTTMAQQ